MEMGQFRVHDTMVVEEMVVVSLDVLCWQPNRRLIVEASVFGGV